MSQAGEGPDRGARPKERSGEAGGRRSGRRRTKLLEPRAGQDSEGAEPGRRAGRSLRQRIQDAVGQCFPIKGSGGAHSPEFSPSQRKIHLRELMLETCPFPAGSELARKWNLIKQHTAPVSAQEGLACGRAGPAEDEDDRLRERRRISIEQGVEPPPDAMIHTFEATAQINLLYKVGPKLAPGMNELAGDNRATLAPQEEEEEELVAAAAAPEPELRVHTQIDYIHCLVPDLLQLTRLPCYWGVMDRYQAEALLEGKPEGTFLLRDSAQEDYLFSVSFRRYGRSLHARVEQWNHNFSFDVHDPGVFHAPTVSGLLERYKDPSACMFFEPLLSRPVCRPFPFALQHLCRAVVAGCTSYDGIGRLPIPGALQEYLKEYHYKQKVRVRRLDTRWN